MIVVPVSKYLHSSSSDHGGASPAAYALTTFSECSEIHGDFS